MRFEDFIKSGKVRRASLDIALSKSLIKMAEQDLEFLKNIVIDDNSARKTIVSYYDTLISIMEAITAERGFKVYSHEAFTYFLKEKGIEPMAEKFDRLRKIQNGINYYGKSIDALEAKQNKDEIIRLIEKIRKHFGV